MRPKPRTLLAICLWCLAGCGADRDPNILVVVIDALRPDHLGCYGYGLETSPTIDALAARGVLFRDATSASSYTRAAVPSIFASVLPSAHGVFTLGERVELLSDDFTTLAEFLQRRGYATAAWAPNPSLHRSFNFDQGVDHYDDDFEIETVAETAARIGERSLRWLRSNRQRPFFAYLHYRDVHAPYAPPAPYDSMFEVPGPGRALTAAEIESQPPGIRHPVSHRNLETYLEQYDGEIRYTDDHLARLLETLSKEGFLDNTAIFLTADHGESFLEHGQWTHGSGLYQELTQVPLILVLPGGKYAKRRVEVPVHTIDIYPTVLDLLGAPIPEELQGLSLVEAIEGRGDSGRPIFSEALIGRRYRPTGFGQLVSVRAGGWKLIHNRWSRVSELYHLPDDVGESSDLVAQEPARARELLGLIAAQDRESARRRRLTPGQDALPADVVEGLRALGYLQ